MADFRHLQILFGAAACMSCALSPAARASSALAEPWIVAAANGAPRSGVTCRISLGRETGGSACEAKKESAPAPGQDPAEAVRLAREGKLQDAISLFRSILAKDPRNLGAKEDYIVVLNWAERDAEAVRLFSGLHPELTPDYVVEAAARSYANLGRYREAMELYRLGSKRSPRHVPFRIGLLTTLLDAGELAAAFNLAHDLCAERPTDIDVLLAAARAFEGVGDFPQALKTYDRVLELEPGHRNALRLRREAFLAQLPPHSPEHLRAVELARDGRLAEALELLKRLHAAAPENLPLTYDLIAVSNWARRNFDALELFGKLDRDYAPEYVIEAAAKALDSLGRFEEALDLYSYALSRSPDNESFAAGVIRTTLGARPAGEAVAVGQSLSRRHPEAVETLLAYAAALKAAGRHVEERNIYEQVLTFDPGRSDVRRLLKAAERNVRQDGSDRISAR